MFALAFHRFVNYRYLFLLALHFFLRFRRLFGFKLIPLYCSKLHFPPKYFELYSKDKTCVLVLSNSRFLFLGSVFFATASCEPADLLRASRQKRCCHSFLFKQKNV